MPAHAIKYYQFREQVMTGKLTIEGIGTSAQIADIFTRPLAQTKFETLGKLLFGW